MLKLRASGVPVLEEKKYSGILPAKRNDSGAGAREQSSTQPGFGLLATKEWLAGRKERGTLPPLMHGFPVNSLPRALG